MTRTVEEVEADFAAADAAWADARETHRLARLAAEDLRRRAMADDSTVNAADLAAADDEAEFGALKIQSRQATVEALEAELRSAKAERFADEFGAAIEPLRQDFEESMGALEVALGRVVESSRAHAGLIDRTYQTAARMAHDATPRVRFPQYQHPSIDRTELRALEVSDPSTCLCKRPSARSNGRSARKDSP